MDRRARERLIDLSLGYTSLALFCVSIAVLIWFLTTAIDRTEELSDAAHEALRRMKAGEVGLAVHPNCGTNFVTAGIAAGLAAYVGFMGANSGSARRERLPLVAALATGALILAQPFGMEIQRHVTTSGEMRGLEIARIERHQRRNVQSFFVTTVG